MAEAVRQVATLAILVSQHTVVIHNAIVVLQQDRERQQQEQTQLRRRQRRRQRSCWVRDWLLHLEVATLTLLQLDGEPSRKRLWLGVPGRLFRPDSSLFLIGLFTLASCCHISLRDSGIRNRLSLLGRGWFDFPLPLPFPLPFLLPFTNNVGCL